MARENIADRNLLFGILALQMDFITSDELVAAMQAWVFDKGKALGELLVERENLTPARRDVLEALVEEHVRLHGGDVGESLVAVGRRTAVANELRAIGDADLGMSIDAIEPNPESTGPYVPKTDGERYQVLRRHAKGGLGEVFVALDHTLNREVAIKQIQEQHANNPASRSRFVQEAEITGALEHPGIVPVYDLGRHADGRPYYAMRFIRGQTLKEGIQAFHANGGKSQKRTLSFRQLLRRFIDTCNAVAYAHSRGVLHRDIKPANIILGRYGETLLADWGLAKPIGRQGADMGSGEESLRPASSSGVADTVAGTAVGTPAYMSPEQAAGQLDRLGPATDVYGLGATLYMILTGKAPVEGEDVGEILRRVQRGDIRSPRRMNASTPRVLEAICQKAMALKPDDRYADALSMANDIEHWLADEPVSAWSEPFVIRSRRWVRRHQLMVGSAVAAVAVLLVCLAVGLGIVTRAYRQEKQAREYAVEQEGEAHRQQTMAEERMAQIEERFRADRRVTEGIIADSLRVPVENSPDELGIRFERANYFIRRSQRMDAATGSSWDLASRYQGIGDNLRRQRKYADGADWYDKARLIYEPLIVAHPEEPVIAFELAAIYAQMGLLEAERADAGKSRAWFDKASMVANERLGNDPLQRLFTHDLIMYLNTAGNGLQAAKKAVMAVEFHEKAAAVAEKALKAAPDDVQLLRDIAFSHYRIGAARIAVKLPAEALAHEEKAKSVLEALAKRQILPGDAKKTLARAYHEAGVALAAAGKSLEALRQYEQAVALREKIVNPQARDVAFTLELLNEYVSVYLLHRDAGRREKCQSVCERAAITFGRLAEDYPTIVEYGRARDEMLVRGVVTLARTGRHQEATRAAEQLETNRRLAPSELYDLACVYGVALAKAQADGKLSDEEKQRFTKSYAEKAIELLKKIKAANYFAEPVALSDLKTDPDLQAVRATAEFKRILGSLEGTAEGSGGSAGNVRR